MDKRMARPAVGPGRSAATRQPRDRNDVGGVMSYRVGFYREIVNSYDTPFKASVYTAELETLGSMDEAITIAIDRFKRDRELSCWSALAAGYEVAYERTTRSDESRVGKEGVRT